MGLGCVEQAVGMWSRKRAGLGMEGLVPGLRLPHPLCSAGPAPPQGRYRTLPS